MNSDWIAVDWGTSNLRAWSVGPEGQIRAAAESDQGMARLSPPAFEPELLRLTGCWLHPSRTTEVIVSGMAGASAGWMEAPYVKAPCDPLSVISAVSPPVQSRRMSVTILPGIKTDRPGPDVIRGEETQIAGFLVSEPDFEGTVCLPGTHTKWVHVQGGAITGFQTFMSGELYSLLANHSTLSACISNGADETDEFSDAVESVMNRPAALAGKLFGIRASSLLAGLSPSRAAARLSGLIIGAELAASKAFWLDRETVIIGAPRISESYRLSLRMQGIEPRSYDVTKATVAGLNEFRRRRQAA